MKKYYVKMKVIPIKIEADYPILKGSRHDNGVGEDRGGGYHDDWEHRHFPWEDPHGF